MIMKLFITAVVAATATPALAMSAQGVPAPGQHTAVANDPDQAAERVVDQFRGRASRSTYDRSSARSVMDFGTAAARRASGPASPF